MCNLLRVPVEVAEVPVELSRLHYLRSLVVRAVHRHRTGVGSIPAGGPLVDDFFSTVPG